MHKSALGWWAACLLATLAVAGCESVAMMGSSGLAQPPRQAEVLGGAVTVRPPRGYCVDPASGQEAEDTAVVMAGRCSDRAPVEPAVMTVAIGRSGSAVPLAAGGEALAAWFTSTEGRRALSRSGAAADLTVVRAYSRGPAFLMRLEDRLAGASWRSVLGIEGRLVTVSVSAPPGMSLDETEGSALLDALVASLSRSNGAPARQAEVTLATSSPAP
jgi:hypothetical protein